MSAAHLIDALRARGWQIATAESCTGGLLAGTLTEIAGSSDVFGCGLVTYSNEIKHQLLGVSYDILKQYGAVSEECAKAMAAGVLRISRADLALVTTGIAGPGGGSAEKPVGLVFIGCACPDALRVERHVFSGDRAAVRHQTVQVALCMALEATEGEKK